MPHHRLLGAVLPRVPQFAPPRIARTAPGASTRVRTHPEPLAVEAPRPPDGSRSRAAAGANIPPDARGRCELSAERKLSRTGR